MTEVPTCRKVLRRADWTAPARRCGRQLRNDEQQTAGLCGPHLAGRKRSAAAAADDAARRVATAAEAEEGLLVADRFRGLLAPGLQAGVWGFGAEIRMTLPAANRLLARLETDDDMEGEG